MHNCPQCGRSCRQDVNYCPACGSYMFETGPAEEFTFQTAPDRPAGTGAPTAVAPARNLYPSCWLRLAAAVIDYLILALACLPGMIVMQAGALGTFDPPLAKTLAGSGLVLASLGFVAVCAYNMVRLSAKGQTIAKWMFRIKIVMHRDQTGNPGFTRTVLLRAAIPLLCFCIPYLGGLLFLLDQLLIFREDRRCLHDFLAGTIVVRA